MYKFFFFLFLCSGIYALLLCYSFIAFTSNKTTTQRLYCVCITMYLYFAMLNRAGHTIYTNAAQRPMMSIYGKRKKNLDNFNYLNNNKKRSGAIVMLLMAM